MELTDANESVFQPRLSLLTLLSVQFSVGDTARRNHGPTKPIQRGKGKELRV